jgi:hypothetical protein
MRAIYKTLSSPARHASGVPREGDPGGPSKSNLSNKIRHRPLYAGDPISFFEKRKMDCPDKPGNDEFVFLRVNKLSHLGPLPSHRSAPLAGDDKS